MNKFKTPKQFNATSFDLVYDESTETPYIMGELEESKKFPSFQDYLTKEHKEEILRIFTHTTNIEI